MCVYEEWIIPPRLLNAKQVKPIESRRGEAAASAVIKVKTIFRSHTSTYWNTILSGCILADSRQIGPLSDLAASWSLANQKSGDCSFLFWFFPKVLVAFEGSLWLVDKSSARSLKLDFTRSSLCVLFLHCFANFSEFNFTLKLILKFKSIRL